MPGETEKRSLLDILVPPMLRFFGTTLPIFPLLFVRLIANFFFVVLYPVAICMGIRKRFADNIREAFQEEISQKNAFNIARRTIHTWLMNFFEIFYFYHPKRLNHLIKKVKIEGIEKIKQAQKKGAGVIGLSAHFGNFPLMMLRLTLEDINMSFLFREFAHAKIAATVKEDFMDRVNLKIITTKSDRNAALVSIKALRSSGFVIFIADEFNRQNGIEVRFFDKATQQSPGPSFIALKTGATMLPIFIIREKKNGHRIVIEDPVTCELSGDKNGDIAVLTQKRMEIIEGYIRQYPYLWLWVHSRWKKKQQPRSLN